MGQFDMTLMCHHDKSIIMNINQFIKNGPAQHQLELTWPMQYSLHDNGCPQDLNTPVYEKKSLVSKMNDSRGAK